MADEELQRAMRDMREANPELADRMAQRMLSMISRPRKAALEIVSVLNANAVPYEDVDFIFELAKATMSGGGAAEAKSRAPVSGSRAAAPARPPASPSPSPPLRIADIAAAAAAAASAPAASDEPRDVVECGYGAEEFAKAMEEARTAERDGVAGYAVAERSLARVRSVEQFIGNLYRFGLLRPANGVGTGFASTAAVARALEGLRVPNFRLSEAASWLARPGEVYVDDSAPRALRTIYLAAACRSAARLQKAEREEVEISAAAKPPRAGESASGDGDDDDEDYDDDDDASAKVLTRRSDSKRRRVK